MEQIVTLAKVQDAISHLQKHGERISRRNVLALTGGGMSTVHKLMSQVEDVEALRASAPASVLSDSLVNTILAEIGRQVQIATVTLQEQIKHLKGRETEALEALADVETRNQEITAELAATLKQTDQERANAEKDRAVATEKIQRLEENIFQLEQERNQLAETAEASRIATAKVQLQFEQTGQVAVKAEAQSEKLTTELMKTQKKLAETEKRAAVGR